MSTNKELSEEMRMQRLVDFHNKGLSQKKKELTSKGFIASRSEAVIGSRSLDEDNKEWVPFSDGVLPMEDGKLIEPKVLGNKLSKTHDYVGTYYNWNGPLKPEYELQEPMSIYDTESYVKRAIRRRLSLTFRNGYEVVGRDRDVAYINDRISTMEYVTNCTFRSLMKKIMFTLYLQGNCFLLKIRKEGATTLKPKESNNNKVPVCGYTILPAHQVLPILKHGIINKWRRYYDTGKFYDEYDTSEVIHLRLDAKSWHIFGTPSTIAVREDIFALRRLEENTELLFINYLFPLFHVTVGTEENPATYTDTGESELDLVKFQIENMPKEGVFVTDERNKVEIVGANGTVLDFMSLLTYYKDRVFSGLGMSELDMGATSHGGSEKADNISQNLKDSIKADVEDFTDQIKFHIFKEWLLEANYSVSVQEALSALELTFHEIDLDNRIKEENHILNLFNNNLITFPEARQRMRLKPQADQMELHVNRNTAWLAKVQSDLEADSQIKILKAQKALGIAGHDETTKKVANGKTKMTRTITKKTAPKSAAVQNIVTPVNQHNQASAKAADAFMDILKNNILPAAEFLSGFDDSDWKSASSTLIDESFNQFEELQLDDSEENSYTRHLQEEKNNLKDIIGSTNNPEELEIILEYSLQDNEDNEEVDGD